MGYFGISDLSGRKCFLARRSSGARIGCLVEAHKHTPTQIPFDDLVCLVTAQRSLSVKYPKEMSFRW